MSFSVEIVYNPSQDIFNAKKGTNSVVTAAPIPGLGGRTAPSDSYIYGSEGATKPEFVGDVFLYDKDDNTQESPIPAGTVKNTASGAYASGSQKRWSRSVTADINSIIEAYATPQIPTYRAWQHFKLAIDGSDSYIFNVETFAEAEFYRSIGTALTKYGITVAVRGVVTPGSPGSPNSPGSSG